MTLHVVAGRANKGGADGAQTGSPRGAVAQRVAAAAAGAGMRLPGLLRQRWLLGAGLLVTVGLGEAHAQTAASPSGAAEVPVLSTINVTSAPEGAAPAPYAGGQVARGASLGMLGNRDYMETPFSTSSYTAALMQDQQARNVSDVLKNDPSVRSVWSDGSYINQFTIRGFAVQGQDMAINGVYGIVPPQMTGGLEGYERVEVLRGPSATLSGMAPSGAVGGAINLVTKRATDTPLAQVTGNYYSDAQYGASIDLGRRFGPDNRVGARLNLAYRGGDTAVDDQGQRVAAAALALDYRGDKVRLFGDFGYHDMRVDAPNRVLFTDNATFQIPAAPDSAKNLGQDWYFAKSHDSYALLRAEADLADNVSAYVAAGGRKNNFLGLYNFIYLQNAAGNFRANQFYQPTFSNTDTQLAGVTGKFATGAVAHEINLSATRLAIDSGVLAPVVSAYTSNIYNLTDVAMPNLASYRSTAPKTAESTLTSYALADTLSTLDGKLQVTAGVRRQTVKVDAFSATTGLPTTSYDKSATTPTAGVVYRPWNAAAFYANYIEGLSQGPTAPAGTANVGAVFEPMKSRQAEAGVKLDFDSVGGAFSLFQIRQPNGYTNSATNTYGLDGEQRNRGAELTAFGLLAPQLKVLGGVSLIDGKLTRTASAATDGNKAVGVPKTTANLGLEWDVPYVSGLSLSGRYLYTASQYYNVTNTQSIPSWDRFDAGARYVTRIDGRQVKLRATVENLFSQDYWASTSSLYGISRGAPRTVLVSVTVDL